MDLLVKKNFTDLWKKYFGEEELPVAFFYSESNGGAEAADKPKGWNCIICELSKVRKGKSLYFNGGLLGCGGSRRYLGYSEKMRPGFEYFLSCGNESMEGERYIRTPEMVKEIMNNQKTLPVDGKNIVFKRWDNLTENDNPVAVVFFVKPDVLAGLFTLANFDQTEPNGTYTPFGAGCSSVVHYPFLESQSERPRAVIGLFDPSARPCVPDNVLTFAVPMKKFEKMVSYMDESFLITETWKTLRKRIDK
jgi:uncharacterized protein (DUF169 family)